MVEIQHYFFQETNEQWTFRNDTLGKWEEKYESSMPVLENVETKEQAGWFIMGHVELSVGWSSAV
jgi:hypothetical protein